MSIQQIDLTTHIKSLYLKNPTILASGILGLDGASLKKCEKGGAGGVTIKSFTKEPRKGHNNPIFVEVVRGGFLNAVGYANKGIKKGVEEFKKWDKAIPLIGSIVAPNFTEFAELAIEIQQIPIEAIEIVLSCPHTPGYGLMAGQGNPETTFKITQSVRKTTRLPLIVKLSPSVEAIGESARAAQEAGADAINMGNTLGPGMSIDIERKSPILDFKVGGMSGPSIRPIMIRNIFDLYKTVKIPLIATGGILTGKDAIEAIMAGARGVSIGTGIYYRGTSIFRKVCQEMTDWMDTHNYKKISELIGIAHEK